MIILLDLDGTLTDTAHESFKPLKDGKVETKISEIPIFPGAKDFVKEIIHLGHRPVIISDSHPKYVEKIARLIFNIPFLISYVSQFMSLLPGDVISTGTPAGVGLGMKPPRFLVKGDVVELGIDGLGVSRQELMSA